MGVYIKGMEMPNKKNGAVLIIYPDGKCAFEDGKTYQTVPVPPHGDLIDRDALPFEMCEYEDGSPVWLIDKQTVDSVPTIIPASEEGE